MLEERYVIIVQIDVIFFLETNETFVIVLSNFALILLCSCDIRIRKNTFLELL